MPGVRSRVKPSAEPEISVSDEASQLEKHLQRQLEEDVARIFDESIYTDIEVVCGKLKILTHSCILKARTNNFYRKLETILHANIERSTFDEIYSFISDAYTECNIKYQEKEIIAYLNDVLNAAKPVQSHNNLIIKEEEDQEVFLTPKCDTPYVDKTFHKSISASPSTELTKEYYALVPIEGGLLDKELIEQDALSSAFQSIIKSQSKDFCKVKLLQTNKPTSLSLTSSHISQTVKHSNSCDILNNLLKENGTEKGVDRVTRPSHHMKQRSDEANESGTKVDSAYSPDSLIADEPSSSSDYLSAAYCSPGLSTSAGVSLVNVQSITKMESTITSSDSGLENTGLLESLNSHRDVTLTDVSLTESTLHDFTTDETNDSSSSFADKQFQKLKCSTPSNISGTSSELNGSISNQSPKSKDLASKSSKEEKQRQNEEIVILESSSLSSETGSWEPVFPPKVAEKQICEKFISSERQHSKTDVKEKGNEPLNYAENLAPSLVQKSPFKSTSCFIDAASLADDDDTIKVQTEINDVQQTSRNEALPAPSRPVPCSTAKFDVSPNDWSESNENEDSLEQAEKDPDSIQKDLSPTIFEMTPITEDSLCTNFEAAAQAQAEENKKEPEKESEKESFDSSNTVLVSGTPHNSILSLRASSLKQYESEESESDTTVIGSREGSVKKTLMKFNESSPIVSGGASIEDHLPHMASHSGSPLTRRRIENIPIVSGAYIPQPEEKSFSKSPKLSNSSAWVVDISDFHNSSEKLYSSNSSMVKRPGDRTCELLRNGSKSSLDSCHSFETNKSRSSIDSDGSEKSSHKFYIDLSSLPDPIPPKNVENESASEKKNIFSFYFDLGEKPVKEMPARLSSSFTTKKTTTESANTSKSYKAKTQGTDSPAKSGKTNNPNQTQLLNNFEKYEDLCNDPNINITEIIDIIDKESSSKTSKEHPKKETIKVEKDNPPRRSTTDRSRQRTAGPFLQDEAAALPEMPQTDLFVKLSDLDKPVQPTEFTCEEKTVDVRMTRSIPENTWADQNNVSSRSIEVISSFHSENALSLNRLFPHLRNEFSRSMPGSLSSRTRSPLRLGMAPSPGEAEEHGSDMSDVSSVHSSMGRSVIGNSTTEDSQTSSLIDNCQSRLGQDLLRMFVQEIAPDVVVEVSGRRIRAHKCILSSRCQYFAGILSGGWVESSGNVIVLPPFSYNVVHFALCHIYSGVSTIPDSISIVELATIADMLGLEGLKEAIMFTLKAKYCHHFHRPCTVCVAGVLECFPLSSVYGLDDLYRKCLRWITKYFSKVWSSKAFATLPKELLDKCYHQIVVNISIENFIDTVYGCGLTVASLPESRWAEVVARLCRRLVSAAAHHAAPRLLAAVRRVGDLPADAPPPAVQALNDCFALAIEWAPAEETCRAYGYLSSLMNEFRQQRYQTPDLIQNRAPVTTLLIHAQAPNWILQCEVAIVKAAPRIIGTQSFRELHPDLRRRLRELGCIMYRTQAMPAPAPSNSRRPKPSTRRPPVDNNILDMDRVRASFVPYAQRPLISGGFIENLRSDRLNDSRFRKLKDKPPIIRTTKAQEERAKFNMSKTENKPTKPAPVRTSFENTRPRYLEPKSKESERKAGPGKKLAPRMISSSESSRNSSPIQARNMRTSRGALREVRGGMRGSRGEIRVERGDVRVERGDIRGERADVRGERADVRGERGEIRGERGEAMSQDSLASRPRTAEPSTDSLSESQTSNKYATYTKTKHVKGSVESVSSSVVNSSSCASVLPSTSGNKVRTKIPVYLNQPKTNGERHEPKKTVPKTATTAVTQNKRPERKAACSLMSATKSSSAKMVAKVVKETASKNSTKPKKVTSNSRRPEQNRSQDIPAMERSGTFLKDEPTFGDKTTNIDIDSED